MKKYKEVYMRRGHEEDFKKDCVSAFEKSSEILSGYRYSIPKAKSLI